MAISLKVIIYLIAASVTLWSVTGHGGGSVSTGCDNTPVSQTAHLGGSVTINCKYPRAESHTHQTLKYFCRENEKRHCTTLISTYTAKHTKLGRFSLLNKQQGVFTVIIAELTQDDAGRYKCAVQPNSTLCLTEIHLRILNWDDIPPTEEVQGQLGKTVQISCSYPDIHSSNEKYLCKGNDAFKCEELIHTTEQNRTTAEGRFFIRDNRRRKYFYVEIKNLSPADSGTYWCGSDRTRQQAEFTKILLSVGAILIHNKSKFNRSDPQLHSTPRDEGKVDGEGPTKTYGIVGGVLGCLALLLILVVVCLLVRHKLPRIQVCCASWRSSGRKTSAEAHYEDLHYEEIQVQNKQESSRDVLTSVNATVSHPADPLLYASVSFSVGVSTSENVLPDQDEISSAACDYSLVGLRVPPLPPAAERTLCPTVAKPGEP